jgi:hypothetical protein
MPETVQVALVMRESLQIPRLVTVRSGGAGVNRPGRVSRYQPKRAARSGHSFHTVIPTTTRQ